ncbi:hypothetical protein DVS28_b0011 (plasmid) [Euzebya pacifica]|uniref:Uncharacterized protein n=1 Tax=Euzebya pacifica TaxID=1608957 RepID=A0A346Y5N4_9ACTN|nr:hypothetical protein [Euzebya pacifica]AXV09781.1 hypothetical protein DVS28_b0011 [Euzebya pacifica]
MDDHTDAVFRDGVAADRLAGLAMLDLRCGTGMWRARRAHRAAVDLAADLGIDQVWLVTSPARATVGEWPEVFGPGRTVAPADAGRNPDHAVVVVDLTALRGHRTVGLAEALAGRVLVTTSSLGSRLHGLPVLSEHVAAAGSPTRR